ncbi:ABC transporter C family member 8 [Rhynchospora pubera]|nr:ABC transporter C family member 8 [Rhynchospora pubera]
MQSMSTYWLAIVVQLSHISSGVVVGVYAALSTSSCVFAYFRSYFAARLGLNASKAFFEGFMDSVFEAPMVFFDSTPVGRILTRASSDLSILDFDIPYSIAFVVTGSIEVAVIIVIMSTVTWQVLIIAIPVLIVLIYVQRYYVASARELVRINGTTKAPVMNYASESMLGVVTIRAFGATERFVRTSLGLIDQDASLFFHTIASLEWVLLRVEMLQSITIITSSLFLIFVPHGSIAPGFMGLCLSYSLTLTAAQVFLTRYYSSLEHYIISVERIKQYMHIPPEPPAVIEACRPSPSWPSQGNIELQNLMVKYRPNAPFVLKGITCTFRARDKVGVVGRTGSGKSTLISSLFRLVDPAGGKILIDNLDICSIGLKDLRTKLSIIPQEPTLFRGTVRTNLDPLGLHSDHEIWEVLEKCQLKSTISSLPTLLDSPVSDDGENWSAGQRQLFCLGRVLLRKNKILVLDEATASIDSATDAVLQKVIKREFASCTVITIAHRVPTVTDSDMVLVLSYGKLEEYDKPSRLMERKNSAFSKLVQEYWSNCMRSSAIEETII